MINQGLMIVRQNQKRDPTFFELPLVHRFRQVNINITSELDAQSREYGLLFNLEPEKMKREISIGGRIHRLILVKYCPLCRCCCAS